MSFKGLLRQNSHNNYILEGTMRSKGSLWQRRSLNEDSSSSKRQHNFVTSLTTLPRGQKQTYGLQQKESNTVEMCTFVCSVQANSPAESAGLTTGEQNVLHFLSWGDVIISINGVCTEGSAHQRIVSLIREIELEKKLRLLKTSVTTQGTGNMNTSSPLPSLDSPMSLASPGGRGSLRFSSDSSCRSTVTDDGDDGALPCVFEDPFSPNHTASAGPDGSCFFPWDLESQPSLSRTRSSSLAGSNGSLSPSWDALGACSLFGTLPRKARRGSVRKRIMKFLPGINRPVEEEENN
ncbi:hypothetical protein JZ751_027681 [Albula glossodonta]|uniref:PDZ domain-containing protein n=1 Tax=Albula glossodonta TaxID=121402 RepID=A0A8T2PIE5_9TELE|nr:hypothetical protein JZ751_027681 [Albula glossodonta]